MFWFLKGVIPDAIIKYLKTMTTINSEPKVYFSESTLEPTEGWYEDEYACIYEHLAKGRPFFTQLELTTINRFFFKDLPGFQVKVFIFESNWDMLDYIHTYNENKIIDILYQPIK